MRSSSALTIPSWNQIAAVVESMRRLRGSSGFAAWSARGGQNSGCSENPSWDWNKLLFLRWFRYAIRTNGMRRGGRGSRTCRDLVMLLYVFVYASIILLR